MRWLRTRIIIQNFPPITIMRNKQSLGANDRRHDDVVMDGALGWKKNSFPHPPPPLRLNIYTNNAIIILIISLSSASNIRLMLQWWLNLGDPFSKSTRPVNLFSATQGHITIQLPSSPYWWFLVVMVSWAQQIYQ